MTLANVIVLAVVSDVVNFYSDFQQKESDQIIHKPFQQNYAILIFPKVYQPFPFLFNTCPKGNSFNE
jgi:hypothetical protein